MKLLFSWVLLLSLLQLTANEISLTHQGPKVPFKALPEWKGHELTVFATSPEVNCPVSIIAEPSGAIYALCDNNAGLGLDKNQGSIVRLVDKDGDGKADVMTKFVEHLDTPRGGVFLNDKLYVMHPPFISSFKDTNGDGVADEHKILAKGFSHDLNYRRGADHSSNDLKIGIDGWIYTAIGDFGAMATGSDGSKVELYGGGVIRLRLDGSDLQVYAEGTRNTYDIAMNHQLDVIALDNTNDGDGWNTRLHHLTPLAHMGYPNLYKHFSEDAMPPLFDHGGGSGVGAMFLQEPGFPSWLNDRFQMISWGRMYTQTLKRYEATFIQDSFETFQFNKLVEIDVDGSSRLYLNTFENGGARTPLGTTVGRIVQAKPKGWQYKAFPNLKNLSEVQLIEALDKKSNVLRHHAQVEIINQDNSHLDESLVILVQDTSASIEARIAALYALNLRKNPGSIQKLKSFLVLPELKEYAIRALLDRKEVKTKEVNEILKEAIQDKNPRVQLQAIVGIQQHNLNNLTESLLKLSDDSGERQPLVSGEAHVHRAVPHTARRALVAMKPISELLNYLDPSELQKATLAVLRQIHDERVVKALVKKLDLLVKFEEKLPLIGVLCRLYNREKAWDGKTWWGTKPNSSGPYYEAVTWESSNQIAKALREEVEKMNEEQQKKVLLQVRKHNILLDELKLNIAIDPMEQLVEQTTHTFSQLDDLLSVVNNIEYGDEFRMKAFRAALEIKGFQYGPWCKKLLISLGKLSIDSTIYKSLSTDFVQSPSHRVTFFQRIPKTYSQVKKMPSHLHRLFCDMVMVLILSPLTNENDKNRLIVGMKKEVEVELIESIVSYKVNVFKDYLKKCQKHKNTSIAKLAKEALDNWKKSENLIEQRLVQTLDMQSVKSSVLKLQGDSNLGQQLFTRQSCSVCHSVLPSEPQKGPYLGSVGNLFDRSQLIQHILEPAAEVAQGFQTHTFTMKDNSTVNGFVSSRDESVLVVRSMFGTSQTLNVKDVKNEVVSSASMMPPGLVNTLSLYEFASLVDYLQSLH